MNDGTPSGRIEFAIGWLVSIGILALCAWKADSSAASWLTTLLILSAIILIIAPENWD